MKQLSLIALALALLAGCGTAAGSASPSVASVAPSVAPATASAPPSSAPPSAAPSPSVAGPGGSGVVDGLPHDDPGLEARLPSVVDGKPLTTFSVGPISVAGNPGADPVKNLVKEIGDGTGDFGLAFANDASAPSYNIFALRVPGADPDEARDPLRRADGRRHDRFEGGNGHDRRQADDPRDGPVQRGRRRLDLRDGRHAVRRPGRAPPSGRRRCSRSCPSRRGARPPPRPRPGRGPVRARAPAEAGAPRRRGRRARPRSRRHGRGSARRRSRSPGRDRFRPPPRRPDRAGGAPRR